MFFKRKQNNHPENSQPKDDSQHVIQVQWGGYYSSKWEGGEYRIFRLLDLNKDAYHSQFFKESFDKQPTFEEVKVLEPYILHVPIAVGSLFDSKELSLLGSEELNNEALAGYKEYWVQMGAKEDDPALKELMDRLIGFSKQGPMNFKLLKKDDQVSVALV